MNVNFVGKFGISKVVEVVHMSMTIGAKIWCHEFWEFRPKLKGDFWVLVCLVKLFFKWLLEPLCTLVWLYVISLKFKWFWDGFGWKMFMELLWVFHECSSLFLMFLPRTKRFGVLIQSFELFHKVFVLRYFHIFKGWLTF